MDIEGLNLFDLRKSKAISEEVYNEIERRENKKRNLMRELQVTIDQPSEQSISQSVNPSIDRLIATSCNAPPLSQPSTSTPVTLSPYPPITFITPTTPTTTPTNVPLQGLKDQLQIAYKTEKFNDATGIGE